MGAKIEKKISKIRDSSFGVRSMLRVFFGGRLRIVFYIKPVRTYIPQALKHLPFFYPKSRNMTSLKRHFLNKTSRRIFLKF